MILNYIEESNDFKNPTKVNNSAIEVLINKIK